MSRLETAVAQIRSARLYTKPLIESIDPDDWFRMPSVPVTHIAWQVGHLAAAEYFLTLSRIRGPRESDEELISETFRKTFGRGSTPEADPAKYPSVDEIRRVFDAVHRQAVAELKELDEAVFDEPVDPPHPMFSTKGGALQFCPQHEMLHAGQIGLIRRILGSEPLR